MALTLTSFLTETVKAHGKDRGPDFAHELVAESVAQEKFDENRFSVRDCAAESLGPAWQAKLARMAAKRQTCDELTYESQDAIDLSTFQSVLGAVLINKVRDSYTQTMDGVEDLIDVYPTPDNLDVITDAMPAELTDQASDVAPAMPYPKTGATSNKLTLPAPVKTGLIGQVTLELVKANATKKILNLFGKIGDKVALVKKKRILRIILGIDNNFKRNGTSYNTYLTSGAWINALDDFDQANGPEEFDRLIQLWEGMTDPITGEAIDIDVSGMELLVPGSNVVRTRKNVAAETINDKSTTREIVTANPMQLPTPKSSLLIKPLLTSATGANVSSTIAGTYAILGNMKRAFAWREVEPHVVLERDGELASEVGWEQDIVYAAKSRIWGVACVLDPLQVTRGRKTS